MSPANAAKLLDLPADATPEQLEVRFLELRTKLEDKIAKAPTPGLKAKYRESLEETTTAFETLVLAADSSSLPVASKQSLGGGVPSPRATTPVGSPLAGGPDSPSGLRSQVSGLPPAKQTKSGGKEFLLVAVIAVLILAAGGWWVMNSRAENARTAEAHRLAEEIRGAAEARSKTERDQRERLLNQLRVRVAELNVGFDAFGRIESVADRDLSELRTQERDLLREAKGELSPALRLVSARTRAQDRYVAWLRDMLPSHPAKIARARTEQLLEAGEANEAATAVDAYAAALGRLKAEIEEARAATTVTGSLRIESNLPDTTWKLVDAFGLTMSGTTPAQLNQVAVGRANLVFSRPRWPDLRLETEVVRQKEATVSAEFVPAILTVNVQPADARVAVEGVAREPGGTWKLEPGLHYLEIDAPGLAPRVLLIEAAPGAELREAVTLDQNFARAIIEISMQRLNDTASDKSFLESSSSIAWGLRGPDERRFLSTIFSAVLSRPWSQPVPASPLRSLVRQAAARGMVDETRALVRLQDRLSKEGLLPVGDSIEQSINLTSQAVALAAVGDSAGAEGYLVQYASASGDKTGLITVSGLSIVAKWLADMDLADEARRSADRARTLNAGKMSLASMDSGLAQMEMRRALRQGEISAAVTAFRKATELDIANNRHMFPNQRSIQHIYSFVLAARLARSANAHGFIKPLTEYVTELLQMPHVEVRLDDSWAVAWDLVSNDGKFQKERERLKAQRGQKVQEARTLSNPQETIQKLTALLEELQHYQAGS